MFGKVHFEVLIDGKLADEGGDEANMRKRALLLKGNDPTKRVTLERVVVQRGLVAEL
jgi:hypothetical protein